MFLDEEEKDLNHIKSVVHVSVYVQYLVVGSQSVVSQQRPVMHGVRGGVDEDGSVLYLEDLDAVSHHRRHTELTQLQRKTTVSCQLWMIKGS